MMSGGLDSSTVAAIAAGPGGAGADRCVAVTAVYDTLFADPEREFSSTTARALGLAIEHVPVDAYELFARWHQDAGPPEPSVEVLSAIMRDLLLRAGRHAGVALTGDGGDPALLPGAVVRHVGRVRSVALARGVWQTLQRGQWPPLGLRSGLRRWTAAGRPAAPSWLASRLRRACDPPARWTAHYERLAPWPSPRGEALAVLAAPGWPQAFESVDPNTTGLPVELRYPLFDARVVSLALSLPSYPWCVDKTVLREAMRRPAARRHPPASEDRAGRRSSGPAGVAGPEGGGPDQEHARHGRLYRRAGLRAIGAGHGPADRPPAGDAGRGRLGHLARHGRRPDGGRVIHRFSAYGLAVESNVALPGVAADSSVAAADVILRLAESDRLQIAAVPGERAWYVSPDRDDEDVPWLTVWRGDGFRFVYSEGAEFRVGLDGSAVDGSWRGPLTLADAASYVLGPVLAFALRLRGVVPLHAGAVVARGAALLFAGPAGAGKSSTVAAIGALGHAVLSDDVVPMRVTPDAIVAAAGFPRVSVWDDTASAIFRRAPGNLPPWSASYGKRYIDLHDHGFRFCEQSLPIGAIYLLQPRGRSGSPGAAPHGARSAAGAGGEQLRRLPAGSPDARGRVRRARCRGAAGARQHAAIRRRSQSSPRLVRGAAGVASRR